jgi:hypothetical protein
MHPYLPVWQATGVVVAALLAGKLAAVWRTATPGWFDRAATALHSRRAPWVIGLLSAAIIWYAWGYLRPTPVIHDEASYLLQAKTFAAGRWSNPAPPIAEFFEQFHVLVSPTFASKYPPGTALLMVPGVWLGFPALVLVLLSGATGALLFMLARRVANAWIALLAWGMWIATPATLWWAAGYFSEVVSAALWMLGWWALLQWRDTGKGHWLVLFAVGVAWMAISRPLTAVAYALPLGGVVLWLAFRRRQWRQLVVATVAGSALLAVLPLSSRAILGTWRAMPWSVYSQQYLPSDRFGFGVVPEPPARELPPDMRAFHDEFMRLYEAHVPANLPSTASQRLVYITAGRFTSPRAVLLPLMLIGVLSLGAELAVALVSAALLFGLYLGYAHEVPWTVYYHEMQPTLAFMAALGFWRLASWLTRWRRAEQRENAHANAPIFAAATLMLLAAPYLVRVVERTHDGKRAGMARRRAFYATVARLPTLPALVFVRYAPRQNPHRSIIVNEPNLATASVWLVRDRGPDNDRLLRAVPGRTAYLYDEETGAIRPYARFAR